MSTELKSVTGEGKAPRSNKYAPLTCERCGNKTEGGEWLGFVYVGPECLTNDDKEDLEAR